MILYFRTPILTADIKLLKFSLCPFADIIEEINIFLLRFVTSYCIVML